MFHMLLQHFVSFAASIFLSAVGCTLQCLADLIFVVGISNISVFQLHLDLRNATVKCYVIFSHLLFYAYPRLLLGGAIISVQLLHTTSFSSWKTFVTNASPGHGTILLRKSAMLERFTPRRTSV